MRANELRIGNFVGTYNEGEEDKRFVVSVDNIRTELKANKQGYSRYRPIPLNEEWLLKFGFEQEWDHRISTCKYYDENFKILRYSKNVYYLGDEESIRVDIHYVHQLQNLYFALTGEELTIKE